MTMKAKELRIGDVFIRQDVRYVAIKIESPFLNYVPCDENGKRDKGSTERVCHLNSPVILCSRADDSPGDAEESGPTEAVTITLIKARDLRDGDEFRKINPYSKSALVATKKRDDRKLWYTTHKRRKSGRAAMSWVYLDHYVELVRRAEQVEDAEQTESERVEVKHLSHGDFFRFSRTGNIFCARRDGKGYVTYKALDKYGDLRQTTHSFVSQGGKVIPVSNGEFNEKYSESRWQRAEARNPEGQPKADSEVIRFSDLSRHDIFCDVGGVESGSRYVVTSSGEGGTYLWLANDSNMLGSVAHTASPDMPVIRVGKWDDSDAAQPQLSGVTVRNLKHGAMFRFRSGGETYLHIMSEDGKRQYQSATLTALSAKLFCYANLDSTVYLLTDQEVKEFYEKHGLSKAKEAVKQRVSDLRYGDHFRFKQHCTDTVFQAVRQQVGDDLRYVPCDRVLGTVPIQFSENDEVEILTGDQVEEHREYLNTSREAAKSTPETVERKVRELKHGDLFTFKTGTGVLYRAIRPGDGTVRYRLTDSKSSGTMFGSLDMYVDVVGCKRDDDRESRYVTVGDLHVGDVFRKWDGELLFEVTEVRRYLGQVDSVQVKHFPSGMSSVPFRSRDAYVYRATAKEAAERQREYSIKYASIERTQDKPQADVTFGDLKVSDVFRFVDGHEEPCIVAEKYGSGSGCYSKQAADGSFGTVKYGCRNNVAVRPVSATQDKPQASASSVSRAVGVEELLRHGQRFSFEHGSGAEYQVFRSDWCGTYYRLIQKLDCGRREKLGMSKLRFSYGDRIVPVEGPMLYEDEDEHESVLHVRRWSGGISLVDEVKSVAAKFPKYIVPAALYVAGIAGLAWLTVHSMLNM